MKWSSQGGLRVFFLNFRGNIYIVFVVVLVSELSEPEEADLVRKCFQGPLQ